MFYQQPNETIMGQLASVISFICTGKKGAGRIPLFSMQDIKFFLL
jgi:hypothetical protein